MEKSQTITAKIISIVFHPLLMPTYALLIIFNSDTHYSYLPFAAKRIIFILVFLTTFLVPVAIIPFLVNLKAISNFALKNKQERIVPLLITSVSYYFSFYLLNRLPLSTIDFIKVLVLACALLILMSLFISIKWKISAHLIGIGGLISSMFFYANYFVANFTILVMLLCLLAGAIAFARLQLGAHSPAQVYIGFLTGFIGMLIVLYLGV